MTSHQKLNELFQGCTQSTLVLDVIARTRSKQRACDLHIIQFREADRLSCLL